MKLAYHYMAFFFNFQTTLNHLYPLQADSNSRLVVDEDDNGKFRLERVKSRSWVVFSITLFEINADLFKNAL